MDKQRKTSNLINIIDYDANDNVLLGEHGISLGFVDFDNTPTTAPTNAGSMYWNDADGTANLILKGGEVTLQIGQETLIRVVNKTATNINLLESNYQAVRITGAQGQRPKVDLAQATNDLLSAETIGLVTETINNNQEGFINTSGLIRGINTTGSLQGETWVDGDILYLSPTIAGNITKVKPVAPNHLVIIGYVIHAHITQGTIFVKVDNGYELDELHNVKIDTPLNDQSLVYNSTTQIWENKTTFQLPTLTSGSVLFSNGTTIAQDNANLFWDDTNNRLGIGTNLPQAKIDIRSQGALSTDIAFRVRNSVDNADLFTTNGLGQIRSLYAGTPGVAVVTAKFLTFATSPFGLVFRGDGLGVHSIQNQREANNAEVYDLSLQPFGAGVLIGTATSIPSSALAVQSTTRGFLPPRMTNAQRLAIASPAVGLIVYCTDATEGLYENTSTGWVNLNAIDAVPTNGSANAVSSNGVFDALATKQTIWKSGIDGTTVANTLTITPTYSQLIPANTFVAGDVVTLDFRFTSPAKTSITNAYLYVNTTNTVAGAAQLGIYATLAGNRTLQMNRILSVKGATTKTVNPAAFLSTDVGVGAAMTAHTIDWTINQYIIFAIGHTVADQTSWGDFYKITK